MKSEQDQERCVWAESCTGCLGWHHICKAECCKILILNITKKQLEDSGPILTLIPSNPLTYDELIYYRRRGVECIRGMMRFKKEWIIETGGKIIYVRACNRLDGMLCKDHGKDTKPKFCKLVDHHFKNTNKDKQGSVTTLHVTENCLYKYKEV